MSKDADAAKHHQLKTLWALIEANGLTDGYKGLTGNSHLSDGVHVIAFNRNVHKCAATATLSDQENGEISIFKPASSPSSVDAFTHNSQGSGADKAFDLVVNC